MKRIWIMVLSMCLILIMTPVTIKASETKTYVEMTNDATIKAIVVQKSLEAFPEYEKEIRGENVSEIDFGKMRARNVDEVVYTETRKLSDTEMVTYTQYESGLVTTAVGYVAGNDVGVTDSTGYYATYTMDAWLHNPLSSDVLTVRGIQFVLFYDGYDQILNRGTIVQSNGGTYGVLKEREDNSVAYAEYQGWFSFGPEVTLLDYIYMEPQILRVEIGNNTWSVKCK